MVRIEQAASLQGKTLDAAVGGRVLRNDGSPVKNAEITAGDVVTQTGGAVALNVKVQAPSWMDVQTLRIIVNGDEARTIDIPASQEPSRFDEHTSAELPWPLVVITAPVDAWLGNANDLANPYAPAVPVTCESAPVRALVFDARDIGGVRFSFDNGEWIEMSRRRDNPAQWRGRFAATAFAPGIHYLSVEARGSHMASAQVQVNFADAACELGEEDPDNEPRPPADAGADAGTGDAALPDAAAADAGVAGDGGGTDGALRDASGPAADGADGRTDGIDADAAGGDSERRGGAKDSGGCSCSAGAAGPGPAAFLMALFMSVLAGKLIQCEAIRRARNRDVFS